MDLCTYRMEDEAAAARRQHTCVLMCRLHRKPGAPGQWEVEALGRLCSGSVDSYEAVRAAVRGLVQERDCPTGPSMAG
jgi:hypothetical protein